jgi:ferredoxin--NADP+ reductase
MLGTLDCFAALAMMSDIDFVSSRLCVSSSNPSIIYLINYIDLNYPFFKSIMPPYVPSMYIEGTRDMANIATEQVLSVRHWNDSLFSFTTTRSRELRFENGHFVMVGLEVEGKPLMRAYSIASPNYEDHLEFFSIKAPGGALTSRLQHVRPDDQLLIGRKPVGTLVVRDLKEGETLYMLATGTGLAPFLSLIRDPEVYERFDKVVLVHGVRTVSELAYADFIRDELPSHELLGAEIAEKLIYYPTVTREPYVNRGRLTDLIESGKLFADTGLPPLDPARDRAMICGGPSMLAETSALLDACGFAISPSSGVPGDYVIERAFVER